MRTSVSGRSASASEEAGRSRARVLYELEMSLIDEGVESRLVYDEEQDLFRFPDGRFALDAECADVDLLWRRGYLG